jgi:uncharacterized membrane protein YfcA
MIRNVLTARNLYAWSVGLMAGGVVGTVGFGGAQVVIPSMTATASPMIQNVAGYSQLAATGISLASLSISTISSGYNFWKDQKVHVPIAIAIGIPAVIAARLGTSVAKRISHDALALFFNGFSILLMPTHYYIQHCKNNHHHPKGQSNNDYDNLSFTVEDLPSVGNNKNDTHQSASSSETTADENKDGEDTIISVTRTEMLQHAGYGLFSGILSALMGVGGLPITISYLTLATTDMHHHTIQGTAVCSLIPAILVSAASRWSVVPIQPAICVAGGAVVGSYAGSYFALHLDEDRLRQLYMASLVLFGSRSVYGAVGNLRNIIWKVRK